MGEKLRRVPVTSDADVIKVVKDVKSDGDARVLEENGRPVAVVLSPAEFDELRTPTSRRRKEGLLALAGSWGDGATDAIVDDIYNARHASPKSPPLAL